MRRLLNDILYDYFEQNGHYLVLSGANGFKMQDLDEIQVNMLQNNDVPRLLPMHIEERDFNIYLYYELNTRRTLRNFLRTRKVSLNEFLQVLLVIAGVLEDSNNYMLNERNYLLDLEFIYIGNDSSDLFLVYIPVKELNKKESVYSELKEMIAEMAKLIPDISGDTLKTLREHFSEQEESFNISKFKQMIITLINRPEKMREKVRDYPKSLEPVQPKESTDKDEKNIVIIKKDELQDKFKQPVQLSERIKIITICAALFLIALVWKVYLDHSGEGQLYISLGLTILILDSVFFIFKVWQSGSMFGKTQQLSKPAIIQRAEPQAVAEINEHKYYQDLEDKTQFKSGVKEEDTVWEENEPNCDDTELLMHRPYLEIMREGKPDIIEITSARFIIGRKSSEVEYAIEDKKISRKHLEIFYNTEGWAAKDLGSKNYSYINGDRMLPNEVYPLNNEDRLQLANIEYVFKMRQY